MTEEIAYPAKVHRSRPSWDLGSNFRDIFKRFDNHIAVGNYVKRQKRRSKDIAAESLEWKWILAVVLSVVMVSIGVIQINKIL